MELTEHTVNKKELPEFKNWARKNKKKIVKTKRFSKDSFKVYTQDIE